MSIINPNSLNNIIYPNYMEKWRQQCNQFWTVDSITYWNDDATRFHADLTEYEKNIILNIFKMFTLSDEKVTINYLMNYMPIFKNTEVSYMLTSFVNMETVHAMAYKKLTDVLGCTDAFYDEYLTIPEMKAKHDQWLEFNSANPYEVAKTLAFYGGFVEGVQIFSSFTVLLHFAKHYQMNAMSAVVLYSMRDENLHAKGLTDLFKDYVTELLKNGVLTQKDVNKLYEEIYVNALVALEYEEKFIDLIFSGHEFKGLTAEKLKAFVRLMFNQRLTIDLGLSFDIVDFNVEYATEIHNSVSDVFNLSKKDLFFETDPQYVKQFIGVDKSKMQDFVVELYG